VQTSGRIVYNDGYIYPPHNPSSVVEKCTFFTYMVDRRTRSTRMQYKDKEGQGEIYREMKPRTQFGSLEGFLKDKICALRSERGLVEDFFRRKTAVAMENNFLT